MAQTTIETDNITLSYIKLYCDIKRIPQKKFLKHILKQNNEFILLVKQAKKLNLSRYRNIEI